MRDDAEFEKYVAARWSTFHRLALLLSGSESGADDLLQLTLEKAYVAWPRISRMAAPDAYLRRIMVTGLVSTRRRAWFRHESTTDEPPEPAGASVESKVLDHQLLWPMVCALPERQRAVVVLRYYEDLTESEIADVMGCAPGTVKSTAHDAMQALRRGLAMVPTLEGMER